MRELSSQNNSFYTVDHKRALHQNYTSKEEIVFTTDSIEILQSYTNTYQVCSAKLIRAKYYFDVLDSIYLAKLGFKYIYCKKEKCDFLGG